MLCRGGAALPQDDSVIDGFVSTVNRGVLIFTKSIRILTPSPENTQSGPGPEGGFLPGKSKAPEQSGPCSGVAEMERFELSRAVTRLPHFECGPFNHLGTSPYTQTVYNNRRGMSRGKRPAGSFPVPAEAGTKAGPFEAGEKQAKTQNKIGKKGGETLLFSDTLLTHFYAIFGRFWPYLRDPQKQQKTLKTQGLIGISNYLSCRRTV